MWLLRVSDHRPTLGAAATVLDAGERERHRRFLREADRDRYAAAHLALRRLLGGYLGRDPATVALVREDCPGCGAPHGRPAVPDRGLHFSLSHSGNLVALAFASTPVGVDVEAHPSAESVRQVSTQLHPREREELVALPEGGPRIAAFARCWARKEAYLKGTGEGLSGGPDRDYLGAGPRPAAPPGWTLEDVAVDDGYAAAVAVAHGI